MSGKTGKRNLRVLGPAQRSWIRLNIISRINEKYERGKRITWRDRLLYRLLTRLPLE
jgi:hypothetical protein